MDKEECTYTEIGYVKDRYPRCEYKSKCGLQFVHLNNEVYNGMEYVENPPQGNCPKCKKPIIIKQTE